MASSKLSRTCGTYVSSLSQNEVLHPRRASWRGHGPVGVTATGSDHLPATQPVFKSSWTLSGPGLHCWLSISSHGWWPVQPGEPCPVDGGLCMLGLLSCVGKFTRAEGRGVQWSLKPIVSP